MKVVETLIIDGVRWQRLEREVGDRGAVREPVALAAEVFGMPEVDAPVGDIFQFVDLSQRPWRMTCECGRQRYAKGNSLHQVDRCRICTKQDRLARRRKEK